MDRNKSKGKRYVSSNENDDDALNIEESNQIQSMEVTKYESHKKKIEGGRLAYHERGNF